MTAKEMHIKVEQGIQKIAANRTRKLYPEEIDFVLNGMVTRFIKDGIRLNSEGVYEISELYAQALAPLKVVNYQNPLRKVTDDFYQCNLPADFNYLVSAGISVGSTCSNKEDAIEVTTESWRNYLINLTTTKSAKPYYQTFSILLADGTTISNSQVPGYTGYDRPEQIFQFGNLVKELLWEHGVNAYFEEMDDFSRNGYIIIPGALAPITSVLIDGNAVSVTTTAAVTRTFTDAQVMTMADIRLMKGAYSHALRTTAYYRTSAKSPLAEAHGTGSIYVYVDSSFIVGYLLSTYIRKPRRIDVKLQRNCDIHPDFHEDICDRAVVYLKEKFGQPGWQADLQEKSIQQTL